MLKQTTTRQRKMTAAKRKREKPTKAETKSSWGRKKINLWLFTEILSTVLDDVVWQFPMLLSKWNLIQHVYALQCERVVDSPSTCIHLKIQSRIFARSQSFITIIDSTQRFNTSGKPTWNWWTWSTKLVNKSYARSLVIYELLFRMFNYSPITISHLSCPPIISTLIDLSHSASARESGEINRQAWTQPRTKYVHAWISSLNNNRHSIVDTRINVRVNFNAALSLNSLNENFFSAISDSKLMHTRSR